MKKTTLLFIALFALFSISESVAQKVVIVGMNHISAGAPNDGFTFVATENIPAGEVIYFTENEYNDAANAFTFNGAPTGEAVIRYVVGAGGLATGVVVFMHETSSNTFTITCSSGNCGTSTTSTSFGNGSFNLATNGDTLYAYSDTDENVTNGITEIYSVMFTGSGEAPTQNGGFIPSDQNPVNDYPNAIVIDGFNDDGDINVGPDRVEYMFSPVSLRDGVSKTAFENPSNYLQYVANQDLSIVAFTNLNLAGANPVLTVAVSPTSVLENSGSGMVYTFTLDAAATSAITANFSVGGFATFTTDYTQSGAATFSAASGTVIIPNGGTTATVTITPVGDSTLEPNETVVLSLNAGTGYDAGAPSVATGTIINDDSISITPLVAITGTTHSPPISPESFSFVALDDIAAGVQVYFTENTFDNTTLSFSGAEGVGVWTAPAGGVVRGEVIVASENSPNVFTTSCNSGNCGAVSVVSGTWDLASNGESVFAYQDSDTDPSNGITQIDAVLYTGNSTIAGGNIPGSEDPTNVYMGSVVVDGFPSLPSERTEYDPALRGVTVDQANFQNIANWLHSQPTGALSTVPFANIIIATGSANPALSVTVSPATVVEDSGTGFVYTFMLDANAMADTTINFDVAGTATFTTDYNVTGAATFTATSGTAVILSGTNSIAITITPEIDTIVEPTETIELMIASGTGYDGGTPNAATGSITNDDTAASDPLVAIMGMNHTNPDAFSFAAASDIPAGTVIYFTEDEFDNTDLMFMNGGESVLQYSSPAGGQIDRGDVIVITETTTNAFAVTCSDTSGNGCGTITLITGDFAIASSGDEMYAYIDSDTDPTNGVDDIYSVMYTGNSATATPGGNIPASQDPSGIYTNALVVDGFPNAAPLKTEYTPGSRGIPVAQADFENPVNYDTGAATPPGLSTVPFTDLNIVVMPPMAVCMDVTVQLDGAGNVSIVAADVDGGSTAVNGIMSITVSQTDFTCADIGANTVTLTVTDNDGNMDTCTATVTVEDNISPVITCPTGPINSVCGDDVVFTDATATDNCGFVTVPATIPGFTIFGTLGNSTYFISDATTTGPDAFAFADANNYSLATINNVAENQFITTEINNQATGSLMIGYNDIVTEGTFVWQSGQPSTYTNWGPGEPNDSGGEDYTEIVGSGIWNDMQVIAARRYIIEFTNGPIQIAGIASGETYPQGTTTNTFYVEDASGNSATCSFNVIVEDTVPPMITCPAAITMDNDSGICGAIVTYTTPMGTDNCAGSTTVQTAGLASGATFPVGTTTNTFEVTDAGGNMVSCSFDVIVNDIENPTIICEDVTVELDVNGMASIDPSTIYQSDFIYNIEPTTYAPTAGTGTAVILADDQVSGDLPVGFVFNFFGNDYSQFRISSNGFIGFDNLTDSGCCSGEVIPEQSASEPKNLIALCWDDLNPTNGGSIDYFTTGTAPNRVLIVNYNDVVHFPNGPGIVTGQIKLFETSNRIEIHTTNQNDGGIHTQGVQNIDGTLGYAVPGRNGASWTATNDAFSFEPMPSNIFDNCGIASVVMSQTDFTCADLGTVMVDVTVTDTSGNTGMCVATITVEDNIDPVAVCNTGFVAQLDATGSVTITGADVDGGSTDNCAVTSMTVSPATFDCSAVGTAQNVTLTVMDASGNMDTCMTTIMVEDNIGPTLNCADFTVDLDVNGEFAFTNANQIIFTGATDACGVFSFNNTVANNFTCANIGTFPITFFVHDVNGNTSQCTVNMTVTDTTSACNQPPVAVCQPLVVDADGACMGNAVAADFDGGSSDPDMDPLTITVSPIGPYPLGVTNVTLTVSDGLLTDTCMTTITVNDVTPPVITCPAGPITSQCGDDIIFANPTFTDNCSTAVPTTVPGFTLFGTQGNSTYFISDVVATGPDAFAFADANNYRLATINNATENQFITTEINNQATGSLFIGYNDVASEGAFVWQSGQPSIYTNWSLGEPNNVGDEDYTEIGNAGTWNDLPSTSSRRYLIEFTDGVIQIAGLPSGAQYPQGTTTNTFYVEDASGNSATCSFDVIVADTIDPVITCPADVTLECGDSTLPIDAGMASATDNCNMMPLITFVDNSIAGCGFTETITRTWTADDGNGNVVTCDQIITINDTTPPEFIIPNVPPAGANYTLDNTLTANYIPINTPGNFVGSGDDTAFTVALGAPISIYDNVVSDIRVATNGYLSVSLTDNGPDLSNDCPLPANPSTGDNVARLYPLHDDVVADIYYQYFGTSPYPHPNGTTMGASVIEYVGSHFGGGVVQFQVILFDNSDVIYQYLSDTEDGSGSTIGAQASGTGLAITVACNTAGTTVGTGIYGLSPYGDVLANSPVPGSTCPGNIAVNNDPGVCTANVTFDPITAIDSCGNVTVVQTTGLPSGSDFPVGTTINTFVATDDCGNMATCSFDVVVTDNELPVANCIAPLTVQLDANGMASITAADVDNGSTDNCGIASTTIDIMDFTCADVGPNTVTLTVTDVNGNMSTCTTTVTVEDMVAPVANCAAPFTVQLDANGMASITVADIDNGSTDACGIASTTIDIMDFTCADVGPNTVTLTVTDVNGNVSTCTTVVTIEDVTAPVIACPADISINTTPGDCFAEVSFPDALALDACGIASVIQTMGDPSGSMFPVGDTVIEFTATDVNGNESTCMFTITVMDMEPAMAVCQDITVQLDATGMVTITPADVDGGSSDNCGIATTTIDVDTFDCSDVGPNSVTLTITDVNGNVSTCVAIVTVEDIEAPMVVCQDITVQLDATGTITIVASDLDNGSTDNCTISDFTVDIDTFDCSNVGPNTVVLTATDSSGNTSTCTATVTVEDVTTPDLVCMDFTIELGADGTALLDVANVIASNTDACGIDTSAVDITSFDCSDIGTPVMVEVFTQDVNGNISSCNAIVTVVDVLAPEVTCPADITVDPGANNVNYEVPDYVALGDATAIDNCTDPVVIFTQDPAAGTFLPDGVYPVTITAEDEYGNVGSCTFTLTVESILGGIPNNEISLATLINVSQPCQGLCSVEQPASDQP